VLIRMSRLDHELARLGGTLPLEDVGLPAALLDRDGVVRWQNRASIEATGDFIGSPFTAIVAPNELPGTNEFLSRILCRGEPSDFTLQMRDATGGYSLREVSAAPVRDGETVVGMFGLSRRLSTEHSRHPRSGAKPAAVELTRRQRDVLRLLAEGKSTGEIASGLSLSPTTVRNHIAGLIAALGVHNRLQAVVAARKLGLLDL
jgi:DNA-binding CsgD family transcriptional regulator